MLILYPYTADKLSVFGQQILKGTLTEVDADNLTVLLWHKSVNENFFSLENEKGEERFWAIEPAFQEKNYETQLQALWQIMNISPEKADIFFGKKAPRFDENFRLDYTGKGLNEKQNYVLSKALAAKDYAVLQGPPGTGKTSKMLKNMAHFLFHETNETVVLLAFTNRATDEICEKIKEVCGDNFIRLGNSPDKKWAQYGLRASKSPKEAQQKFAQCRFFVGTVSSFPNFAGMIKQKNTVIIDEASQLLEPHLCGILPFFDRFILIGDEKQLPAVVAQNENLCRVRDENLKNIGILSFSQSLFERLLRNAQKNQWTHAYEMLSDQYRTHEEIANFINKHFYDGKLYPAGLWQREKKSVFGAQTPEFLANNRLIFIECENENLVKVNKSEARTVLQLLLMLREALGDEFTESSVGVITPFRAQIAEITSLLDNTLRKKVTVDTVERFQGSERDIIILSTAVNSKKSAVNIQSLNEEMTVDKKLNVALSRAKKQLILLGNAEILSATHFYGKLLREISCKIHCSECNYVPMRMS
jgi:DNA replication ATP-dependent helicase Dna2